jgi:hypothetical protein
MFRKCGTVQISGKDNTKNYIPETFKYIFKFGECLQFRIVYIFLSSKMPKKACLLEPLFFMGVKLGLSPVQKNRH